jgi:hypothetical protein
VKGGGVEPLLTLAKMKGPLNEEEEEEGVLKVEEE